MKYIALFILFTLSHHCISQYNAKEDGIHSEFRPGIGWFFSGFKAYEVEKLRKYDRLIIDLVYNDWHGDTKAFKSPWSSIGINAAFMFDIPFTQANTVGMGIGIGISHYSNRTKWQFSRDFLNKATLASDFNASNMPKSNLYGANYIELPIEFRFKTKGIQHFKFFVGGKIGYRLNDYTKEVYRKDGKNYPIKQYNFIDSNPLRYGITARIGIRNWALFGAYYFSPIFKRKESVQLYPFSIGISVSWF
ncbi:MAG: PorT family protein [Brumimicrobium sp.]|nr:PorT family protein [Brumimicrobium sp.]MCO5269820.1 PorT family protein [Brumimicrobium sp.]